MGTCKHDWVGDDNCAYCKVEQLERQIDVERMEHAELLAQTYDRIDRLIRWLVSSNKESANNIINDCDTAIRSLNTANAGSGDTKP